MKSESLFPQTESNEVYKNLKEVGSLPPGYERIREMIISPVLRGTVVFFIGQSGVGKSLLARQCLLEFEQDVVIKRFLRDTRHKLVEKLLRYDDCLYFAKEIFGIPWDQTTPFKAHALASWSLERAVYWMEKNDGLPWLAVVDAAVFPFPNRDLGGSAVRNLVKLKKFNTFAYAVLPNDELQNEVSLERASLGDSEFFEEAKARKGAVQSGNQLFESMATEQAMRRNQKLVFMWFDDLIKEGRVPSFLSNFKEDPEQKSLIYKYAYKLQCEDFFGKNGNFMLVENFQLPPSVIIHRYDRKFGRSPNHNTKYSVPLKQITEETYELYKEELEDRRFPNLGNLVLDHVAKPADGMEKFFLGS